MTETETVLNALLNELRRQDPGDVGDVSIDDGLISVLDGEAALAVSVDDETRTGDFAHVHVVTALGREAPIRLDACVTGYDSDRSAALEQSARVWIDHVASAIFSITRKRCVLASDYFAGGQSWGVHGAQGYVGPVLVRSSEIEVDLDAIARARFFSDALDLVDDDDFHLVKATIVSEDGNWTRHLELDGHYGEGRKDESWALGITVPQHLTIMVRFAVFARFKAERRIHPRP